MIQKIIYILFISLLAFNCSEKEKLNPVQTRNKVFQKGILVIVENFKKPDIAAKGLIKVIRENDILKIRKEAEKFEKSKGCSKEDIVRFTGLKQSYAKMAINLKKMYPKIFIKAHNLWTRAWNLKI
ncbi:hypothetical protein ACFL20_07505 [Spirochaetota bacterium]